MLNKSFFTLLLITGLSISGFGQFDPDALEVLDAMSARYKKITAFTADFSQELSNKVADLNESISGKITVKGDKYKLEIAGQQIFNDGENIWSYSSEAKEVTVTPNEPEEQDINLNNIYDLYKDGFKYILLSDNDKGNRIVDLDPIDRSRSYYKIRMGIGMDNGIKFFTIFESSGNQYVYRINNFQEYSQLPDSFFTFNTESFPDVEVIDFR